MATPAGTLVARLTRIRAENRIGKMTTGLGAIQVGFLRRTDLALQPLAARIPSNRAEELRAQASLGRLDAEVAAAKSIGNRALKEAIEAKREARRAKALAASAASGGGGGGGSAVQRLRARSPGRGVFRLAQAIRNPLGLARKALNSRVGGALFAIHGVGIASQVAGDSAVSIADAIKQSDSAGEAARAIGGKVAEKAWHISGLSSAARGGVSVARGLQRVGVIGLTEEQFEQRAQGLERSLEELFMSREAVARRRAEREAEAAKLRAQSEKQIAEARQFLNDYAPRTFAAATRFDRQVYRRDLTRVNQQALNAHVAALRDGTEKAIRELD